MKNTLNKTVPETNDIPFFGLGLMHIGVGDIIFSDMKICSKCKIPKPKDEFRQHLIGKGGIRSVCRLCEKEDRKKFRENRHKAPATVPDIFDEIWKDVVGYEGLYQVSNLGRIKALCVEKYRGKYKHRRPESLLRPKTHRDGYMCATLCNNKINRMFQMHRLVATAFIPNPENKPQVNHIDGNKANNQVENLEWVTAAENTRHSYANGLQKGKLTEIEVIEIYESTKSHVELCRLYNVGKTAIYKIKHELSWIDIINKHKNDYGNTE